MSNSNVVDKSKPLPSGRLGRMIILGTVFALSSLSAIQWKNPPIESSEEFLANPTLPPEQFKKALEAMSSEDRVDRKKRELNRLADEPLNSQALLNLAILADLENDRKTAEEIVLIGAKRSLRDTQAQISAVQILLVQKKYDRALYHMDGLLRSIPEHLVELQPTLVSLVNVPEALPELVKVLAGKPKWRTEFLTSLFATSDSGAVGYTLLSAMRKQGVEVTSDEIRNYIAKQFERKNYSQAYFVWLDFLNSDQLTKVSSVFDGQFELEAENKFFDWNMEQFDNADLAISQKPGTSIERALRLDFFDSHGRFANVYQYLQLTAGPYEFSTDVQADSFQSEGGLVWRIQCVETQTPLGQSKRIIASGPWIKFGFQFTVPQENCSTQLLRLESASQAQLDNHFTGQLYMANLKINEFNPQ
jgi:hypothetical protein